MSEETEEHRIEWGKMEVEREKLTSEHKIEQGKIEIEREKLTHEHEKLTHEREKLTSERDKQIRQLLFDYVKVLVWPFLVVVLILCYREPIDKTLRTLIERFSQADRIAIGGLEAEFAKQAQVIGNPELAQTLSELSVSALTTLVNTPPSVRRSLVSTGDYNGTAFYAIPSDETLAALLELEEKGLILVTEDLSEFLKFFREQEWTPFEVAGVIRAGQQAFISDEDLSVEDQNRIYAVQYMLTDDGEDAITAIVATTLSLLDDEEE